ncbi:MAG: prepilin-type N-terminal cleavage/methylation domain-containing protein [bacterium]|nr:prepilin-type N-terminal cleavage/methylation domain-containing protein [bacterium]
MKNPQKHLNRGLTLVEVLIATSIILIFLMALLGAHNLYLKTALANGEVVKGAYLAEEGAEVVRFLRDSSWDTNIASLSLDTDYYLVWSGGAWQVTTAETLIDSVFERTITLSAVYRDASADIVSSGGTLDPDTLMVVSSVSWPKNGITTTKSISTYITNIFDD